jgi:hypothetical protein
MRNDYSGGEVVASLLRFGGADGLLRPLLFGWKRVQVLHGAGPPY